MATRDVERKLTAIFVTDVAGYSRLMAENPDQTLETLTAYRQVFSEYVEQFHGRIVNRPGDSILAEFGSVVDAVTCAAEVQRELAERNQGLPEQRRMHFRIGVNLGDVLIKDGELFGDGVNIAARLEALADPGGVCISRTVYDQVYTRLDLDYDYLGEHKVKNSAEPLRVYKVMLEPGAAAHRVVGAKKKLTVQWRKVALAASVVAAVMVGGSLAWNYGFKPTPEPGGAASTSAGRDPPGGPPPAKITAAPTISGAERSAGGALQVAFIKGHPLPGPSRGEYADEVPDILVASVNSQKDMEVKYKQLPDSYLDGLKGKPDKKSKFWIKDCFFCTERQNKNLIYRTGKDLEVDAVITYTYTREWPNAEITLFLYDIGSKREFRELFIVQETYRDVDKKKFTKSIDSILKKIQRD